MEKYQCFQGGIQEHTTENLASKYSLFLFSVNLLLQLFRYGIFHL